MTEPMDGLHRELPLAHAPRSLPPNDLATLTAAVRDLQASRGVVIRAADLLAGMFGSAAAMSVRGLKLSPALTKKMQGLAEVALRRAFDLSILGSTRRSRLATPRRMRVLVAASGAVGGFAGLSGFLPDACLTTLLMMRSIAEIAREEGEELDAEDARRACLEVFAFGSPLLGEESDQPDFSYWSTRLLIHGRPMMLLISETAARYGLRISEKFALQAVPLVGAAGGALINSVFLDHYRKLARVHFAIRRLERRYGGLEIREEAQRIAAELRLARRSAAA